MSGFSDKYEPLPVSRAEYDAMRGRAEQAERERDRALQKAEVYRHAANCGGVPTGVTCTADPNDPHEIYGGFYTEGPEKTDKPVCLLHAYHAATDEISKLEAWKAEQLSVEAEWDPQAVGAALGLPLGQSTRAGILPAIMALEELQTTVLTAIEKQCGDDFSEDLDMRAADNKLEGDLKEAQTRLGKIYMIAHSFNRSHICYNSHENWRREALERDAAEGK